MFSRGVGGGVCTLSTTSAQHDLLLPGPFRGSHKDITYTEEDG